MRARDAALQKLDIVPIPTKQDSLSHPFGERWFGRKSLRM